MSRLEDLPVWKAGQLVKLPAFQFYPGDWRKDISLSRCSKAAKGVWVDMLCLMFDAPNRGVLATSGGDAWTDREIAEAIGGDTATNLACVSELLSKEVAHRNGRGAIFSRRMVRDEQTRQLTAVRVAKFRGNGHVTPTVTPVYEDEGKDEPAVAVAFEVRSPTNEELIYAEYPRKVKPREAFKAIGNATKRLLTGEPDAPRFDSKDDVTVWLRQRVQAYARAREGQEKQFTPYPASWFNSGSYLEQEETWYVERNNGKPTIEAKQRASLQTLSRAASAAFGGTHGRGPVAVHKLPTHGSSAETLAGGLAGDGEGLRPGKVSESAEVGLPEVRILPPAGKD